MSEVKARARRIAMWVAVLGAVPTSILPEVVELTRDAASDALREALERGWVRRTSRPVEDLRTGGTRGGGGKDGPARWCWMTQPILVPTSTAGRLLKKAHAGPP